MRRPMISVALTTAALGLAGCSGAPQLNVDVQGAGGLVGRPLVTERYPTATDLPKRGGGCQGDFASYWCSEGSTSPTYRLGIGDQISVSVWGHPDLGSQATSNDGAGVSQIEADGAIFLPFLDRIVVTGRTFDKVASEVRELYAAVIDEPQVDVSVVECDSQFVSIGGAVERQASYALCSDRMTIRQVVEAAGGLMPNADPFRALLVRQEMPVTFSYDAVIREGSSAGEVLLEPGDTLYVPSIDERSVYVFGEVGDQGLFSIPTQGLTILGLLGQAGGYDVETAETANMFLVRQVSGEAVVYEFELAEVLQSPDIFLTDGDRLFLPPTTLTKWSRFWRQVFPFSVANRIGR